MSIKELRALARRLPFEKFQQQMGPFALVQRLPEPVLAQHLMQRATQKTSHARRSLGTESALSLILEFDDLIVTTLPPVRGEDTFSVGRQPDSDVVVDDPSVSKRHAELRWDPFHRQCVVVDLGSTNGTFVNEQPIGANRIPLFDGTVLSFGDVDFWYLLSSTLHEKLVRGSSSGRVLV